MVQYPLRLDSEVVWRASEALLPLAWKVTARILLKRMEAFPIGPEQNGFSRGHAGSFHSPAQLSEFRAVMPSSPAALYDRRCRTASLISSSVGGIIWNFTVPSTLRYLLYTEIRSHDFRVRCTLNVVGMVMSATTAAETSPRCAGLHAVHAPFAFD